MDTLKLWAIGPRRWVYSRLPHWVKEHDFELFACVWSFCIGFPYLLHKIYSNSLSSFLPAIIVYIWGVCLVIGSILVTSGIYKSYRPNATIDTKIGWMRIEALGLTFLGWPALLYGICLLSLNGFRAWVAAAIVFQLAFTCATREASVQEKIIDLRQSIGLTKLPEIHKSG